MLIKFIQCFLVVLTFSSEVSSTEYFTAAVYEHARQGDQSPDTTVQTNLKWYQRAATLAKKQGSDMILFPEYGIFSPSSNRTEIKRHLERIPNPRDGKVIPCNESKLYSDRPILHFLSCTAKENAIVVVANMGGLERCDGQSDCPKDGDLHMNANVAFDKDGALLGRYYKERLFYEFGMDLPREKQNPTFETDFGKFAMFICFDIMWEKMAVTSRLADIDAVLFSTMWVDVFPFYTSTPFFQAWAMGNNATLLAANVQMPNYFAVGSGIFRGVDGAIASTFNPDGISKLVIATIPKQNQKNLPAPRIFEITKTSTKPWQNFQDGKDIPPICSYSILGKAKNIPKDYRCVNEDVSNYTLKKLDKDSDYTKVCSNGFCCVVDYAAKNMNESFYIGVYSGLRNFFNRYSWSEETCFLARCDDFNGTRCSNMPTKSETMFYRIFMTANVESNVVYPSLVTSGIRLVPTDTWTYGKKNNKPFIHLNTNSGIQLLVASLNARSYDKDPPYVR